MKNLLYKEFKLAFHPIIYVFILVFPFLVLAPSYPIAVGLIYVLSAYPILFLGANKGQQSNDILYTSLLPIRKKEVVKARMLSILVVQLIPMIIMFFANFFAVESLDEFVNVVEEIGEVGLTRDSMLLALAFGLVGYSIFDYIFLPWFYKNGRSIVGPTLVGMLVFMIFLGGVTIALPELVPAINEFNLGIQALCFVGAAIIYAILHIFIYRRSARNLEHVDL